MALTRRRAIYVVAESTFATDPSANGSGYLWVPAEPIGDLVDGKEILPTSFATGRNRPTAGIPGADGWSFDFEVPLYGMTGEAGDGTAASSITDDALDRILLHIFGTQTAISGEGLAAASTTTSIILDTDLAGMVLGQVMPVWETGLPTTGARTQWAFVSTDNASATYTVSPPLTAAPTTAAIAYGTKTYTILEGGGATTAWVYDDAGTVYTCLGGRITSVTITAEVGKQIMMKCSVSGDRKSEDTSGKSALPTTGVTSNPTPLKSLLSPVWVGTTNYEVRKIEISFGLETSPISSTAATNGRAGYDNIITAPTITIEPQTTDAILNLKRNQTLGRCLIQLGAGAESGGVLNAMCIAAEQVAAEAVVRSDDNGRSRQTVTLKVSDSGSTARFFQMVRA